MTNRVLGRGFTLVELLAVISIFILVLAIAVPAFKSILYSTERSQASNQVSVALSAARASAVSAEGLNDSAAVFFYDPATRRLRIGIYEKVGTLRDVDLDNVEIVRDVFVANGNFQSVQLPRGWMVRGLSPAGAADVDTPGAPRSRSGWYEDTNNRQLVKETANWIFPETGFYSTSNGSDFESGQTSRQSFMVRFEAGTGAMNTADRAPAIVIDPVPASEFRKVKPFSDVRIDQADNLASAVRRVLAAPDLNTASLTRKRDLFGDRACDTVLARPVSELSVYDEERLAASLGARSVNGDTGSIYTNGSVPALDTDLFPNTFRADPRQVSKAINEWLQGSMDAVKNPPRVEPDARIVSVDRYLGQGREIKP
jgi:putative ubiquitin-RnfH superfamily antitoxin RatB of RatAB toxin-antitoxin module